MNIQVANCTKLMNLIEQLKLTEHLLQVLTDSWQVRFGCPLFVVLSVLVN